MRGDVPRRSAAQVADSREETIRAAASVASVIGLGALSIGSLADELGMSKSGLVGRFGSKEQLQLAALEFAAETFRRTVYAPAAQEPAGLRRLTAICDAWIEYLRRPPFPGGCFLTTASVEFDARPGPVNEAVKRTVREWLGVLEYQAGKAVEQGEISAALDPRDIAFTINALAVGANCEFQLHGEPRSLACARGAMANVLASEPRQPREQRAAAGGSAAFEP